MKKRIILLIGLVLLINVALMTSGCNKAEQAQKEWEKAGSTAPETPTPEKPAEAPKQ